MVPLKGICINIYIYIWFVERECIWFLLRLHILRGLLGGLGNDTLPIESAIELRSIEAQTLNGVKRP